MCCDASIFACLSLRACLVPGGTWGGCHFLSQNSVQATVGMHLMLLNCTLQKGRNGKFYSVRAYPPLLNTPKKNFRDSGNALWSHIGCAGRPPALSPGCPAGSQELSWWWAAPLSSGCRKPCPGRWPSTGPAVHRSLPEAPRATQVASVPHSPRQLL